MKKNSLILMLIFCCVSSYAQIGMNNGIGSSGAIGKQNRVQAPPDKPEEVPIEETVAMIMKQLTPELKLDALQEIAIGNEIKDSMREQALIFKDKETSQEQKMIEFKALGETTSRKIKAYLSPEQIEKYDEMEKHKGENPKKDKSKKGSKKDRREDDDAPTRN